MRIHQGQATVKTGGQVSVENVTELVQKELTRSSIVNGLALISVPHTTCAVAINEDERGLKEDIGRVAQALLEPLARERAFQHDCVDDNARAHLTSILLGHSVALPVAEARLCLGTWQSVFLIEMDGPRTRSLSIHIQGE